jgi:hypothetical protein
MSGLKNVVVLSDLHVGSTAGVWPASHRVEGGGTYEANVYQQWLAACWHEMLAEVGKLRPKPIVVVNGDAISGTNPRDGQLISNNLAVQVTAAKAMLEPLVAASRRTYMIRGTEWHEGKASEAVELLAMQLDTVADPTTGQRSWWELYLELGEGGGPVCHFAHHVGMSSVPWYEATVPLRDGLLLLSELHRFHDGQSPNVRCVVRSHRHRFIHVDAPPDFHVVVTPAWQLKTAYGYKKAASMMPEVGWVLLQWNGSELAVRSRIYALPGLEVQRA